MVGRMYQGDERINELMKGFDGRKLTQPEKILINRHARYIREWCKKPCPDVLTYVTKQYAENLLRWIQWELDDGGQDDALDFYSVILNIVIKNYDTLDECDLF